MQQNNWGYQKCTLGVFIALAFMADFSPDASEFYQRTHRVRLKNSGTSDKKSSHKIKYKKIPRVHKNQKEDFQIPLRGIFTVVTIYPYGVFVNTVFSYRKQKD